MVEDAAPVLKDLEPGRRSIRRCGVADLAEVDHDRSVVRAADGFVVAGAVAGLLGWEVGK